MVALLEHLARKGFVVGYCGSLNPPDPKAGVLVIRDANKNPIFKRLIALVPPLNEPNAQVVDSPGGRKVWAVAGAPIRWWYEKDDAVFSFAPPGADDPVIAVLEGKAPSASRIRAGSRWPGLDRAKPRSGWRSWTSPRFRRCLRTRPRSGSMA